MSASRGLAAGYGGTQALTGIHAKLTSPARPAPTGALRDSTSILSPTGRPPRPSRNITAIVEDDPNGMPAALTGADSTQVLISPNGPGLLIHVSPFGHLDTKALQATVTGTSIRQAGSHESRP